MRRAELTHLVEAPNITAVTSAKIQAAVILADHNLAGSGQVKELEPEIRVRTQHPPGDPFVLSRAEQSRVEQVIRLRVPLICPQEHGAGGAWKAGSPQPASPGATVTFSLDGLKPAVRYDVRAVLLDNKQRAFLRVPYVTVLTNSK